MPVDRHPIPQFSLTGLKALDWGLRRGDTGDPGDAMSKTLFGDNLFGDPLGVTWFSESTLILPPMRFRRIGGLPHGLRPFFEGFSKGEGGNGEFCAGERICCMGDRTGEWICCMGDRTSSAEGSGSAAREWISSSAASGC